MQVKKAADYRDAYRDERFDPDDVAIEVDHIVEIQVIEKAWLRARERDDSEEEVAEAFEFIRQFVNSSDNLTITHKRTNSSKKGSVMAFLNKYGTTVRGNSLPAANRLGLTYATYDGRL